MLSYSLLFFQNSNYINIISSLCKSYSLSLLYFPFFCLSVLHAGNFLQFFLQAIFNLPLNISIKLFLLATFYIYIFFYFWLCWVFVSVRGLSPVAVSGDHSSSRCAGFSRSRPIPLRSTGSRRAGSVFVAHGLSRSTACGIFPDQGLNPCPLHWQADSQPLRHQGSPQLLFKFQNIYSFHTIFLSLLIKFSILFSTPLIILSQLFQGLLLILHHLYPLWESSHFVSLDFLT